MIDIVKGHRSRGAGLEDVVDGFFDFVTFDEGRVKSFLSLFCFLIGPLIERVLEGVSLRRGKRTGGVDGGEVMEKIFFRLGRFVSMSLVGSFLVSVDEGVENVVGDVDDGVSGSGK